MNTGTNTDSYIQNFRQDHGEQCLLNVMREVSGGIPEEILRAQMDYVINIHLNAFNLTRDQGMTHKKQYEGRRIIFLGSVTKVLRDQFYWPIREVARQTKKSDSNLNRSIQELKGLFPPHPTTQHLIKMHLAAQSECAKGQLI